MKTKLKTKSQTAFASSGSKDKMNLSLNTHKLDCKEKFLNT